MADRTRAPTPRTMLLGVAAAGRGAGAIARPPRPCYKAGDGGEGEKAAR